MNHEVFQSTKKTKMDRYSMETIQTENRQLKTIRMRPTLRLDNKQIDKQTNK